MTRLRALCAPLLLCASWPLAAAEIEHVPLGDGIEFITLRGEIESGDAEKFRKLAIQFDKAIVAFDSEGGALLPALEIGKVIHIREFATAVAEKSECISACALIWVAGAKRMIFNGGQVGFHASYMDVGGRQVETGLGNALVGRYLTQLELPEKAIVFATSAPPDRVEWLNAKTRVASGIDFVSLDSDDEKSPATPAVQASAAVSRWRIAATSATGSSISFVDTKSVIRSGQRVRFWREMWVKNPTTDTNRFVGYFDADCTDNSYREIQTNYFQNSKYISDYRPSSVSVEYASPASVFAGIIEAVCTGSYIPGFVTDQQASASAYFARR